MNADDRRALRGDAEAYQSANAARGSSAPSTTSAAAAFEVAKAWPTASATSSASHCEHPETGCAVVSLGAYAARAPAPVRAAYEAQVRHYLTHLEALLPDGPDQGERAAIALSALVGAVLVARAVEDPELAERLLGSVRDFVGSGGPPA